MCVWRSDELSHTFESVTCQFIFRDKFDGQMSGDMLATPGQEQTSELELWDLRSGRHLHTLTGHTGEISAVALSRA